MTLVTDGSLGLIFHLPHSTIHVLREALYYLIEPFDHDCMIMSAVSLETSVCIILDRIICMPTISFFSWVGVRHPYEGELASCPLEVILKDCPLMVSLVLRTSLGFSKKVTIRTPVAWSFSIFCKHLEITLRGGNA